MLPSLGFLRPRPRPRHGAGHWQQAQVGLATGKPAGALRAPAPESKLGFASSRQDRRGQPRSGWKRHCAAAAAGSHAQYSRRVFKVKLAVWLRVTRRRGAIS